MTVSTPSTSYINTCDMNRERVKEDDDKEAGGAAQSSVGWHWLEVKTNPWPFPDQCDSA